MPELVPFFRIVGSCVAEDLGALLHSFLKLNGKTQEGCGGEFERHESAMGEGDVEGALRSSMVPALACGDLIDETEDEIPGAGRVFEVEEEMAGRQRR